MLNKQTLSIQSYFHTINAGTVPLQLLFGQSDASDGGDMLANLSSHSYHKQDQVEVQ